MRFAVESWDPAYGSATESLDLAAPREDVDPAIEVPPNQWEPVPSEAGELRGGSVWFVDGVRRIDARVWIHEGRVSKPGVCASVAAGAVRVSAEGAEVVSALVERGLYTTPEGAGPILTRAGTYQLRPTTEDTPEAAYLAIHQHMTQLEQKAAAGATPDDLVIVDGPLRGRSDPNVVGYVKSQHVQYLPPEQHEVVARLEDGERTPLFLIGGRQTRYSWYLRLRGERPHPLACIVRCEQQAVGEVAAAARCASRISAAVLRFASEPHKDARAPQNLYPIAGLERRLRHLLGDAPLMERYLRAASRATA